MTPKSGTSIVGGLQQATTTPRSGSNLAANIFSKKPTSAPEYFKKLVKNKPSIS